MMNVLFLCTGNSARSILAECLMTRLGAGRFLGYSAGSQPVGQVNPFALELLAAKGFDTSKLKSKSWDLFSGPEAPEMDFIFTVCGSAAAETCPVWPGHPASAHWGLEDPAAVTGGAAEKQAAFGEAYGVLERRVQAFAALDMTTLTEAELAIELANIGRL